MAATAGLLTAPLSGIARPIGNLISSFTYSDNRTFAMGETAADKQFDFGIGPGCTGQDSVGAFTGQAIPPVRVKEVCESLNLGPDPSDTRCCIESICDEDFSPAIRCLTGIIQESIQLPG